MLISIASLRNSPGVSVAALALAWTWPRHAMVAECDPAGGQALAVFDPSATLGRRGTFEAMLAARTIPLQQAVLRQMVTLPDGSGSHFLLPGAHSRREAESLQWQRLAATFGELDPIDVLADCGRLRSRGTPHAILAASDLTVLVVRNDRHSLRALASSVDILREETGLAGTADEGLAVLVVTPNPAQGFPIAEIRKQLTIHGLPVVGELPWHPAAAARFSDMFTPGGKVDASPLLTRARQLASEIGRRALARANRLHNAPSEPSAVRPGGTVTHREPVAPHRQAPIPRAPEGAIHVR